MEQKLCFYLSRIFSNIGRRFILFTLRLRKARKKMQHVYYQQFNKAELMMTELFKQLSCCAGLLIKLTGYQKIHNQIYCNVYLLLLLSHWHK